MICDMSPPAYVHDGDTIRCADGLKIRVAGVQAPDFTSAEPCHRGKADYVCDDRAAERSRHVAERLTLRKMLTCRPVDRSYSRVVARCTLPDGRSLSCALIAAGAAARWDRYWRRYRMGECR